MSMRCRRRHFCEFGGVHGLDEGLPVREVPVERADADAGVAGDGFQRHGPVGCSERRGGAREQAFPVPARVGPFGHSGGSSVLLAWQKRRFLRIGFEYRIPRSAS